jgi:UDP-2-acetamido-2-deoxy-ribo-hexuluronate aminotransferase
MTTVRETRARRVAFFDGSASVRAAWPEIDDRITAVMRSGSLVNGPETAALEEDIRTYTGARHAIACGSGTEALVLLLAAAGLKPGDEVIVPCFTFVGTATSVSMLGAQPVFVDIEPASYAMDPALLPEAITPRTVAIMPVHLFNQPADMTAIRAIACQADVPVLEDSAEGIGMRYDGVHLGLLGQGGVLSFFPTKTLGALGDAGMVVTDDDELGRRCRTLRDGKSRIGQTRVGCTSLMDDIQAAVLRVRLRQLERDIRLRAEIAGAYDQGLASLAPQVTVPKIRSGAAGITPVHYVYLIEADDKPGLVRHLRKNGVETEEYYPRPIPFQPCYRWRGYRPGDFPVAERVCDRAVALPLYPDLSSWAVEYVCETITRFYRGGRAR